MIRFLILLAATLVATNAHARDIWRPYDGPTGISCTQYNDAATLPWKSKGGDIGPAVATIKQVLKVNGLNTFDVTPVMRADGFAVRGDRIVNVYSRENADASLRPRLVVTRAGGVETLAPLADVGISCSTASPTGTSGTLKLGNVDVLFFFPPVPADASAAALEFTVSKAYSGPAVPTWTLHAVTIPRQAVHAPRIDGIASKFNNDAGIEKHPSVLFATGFEPGQPYATNCPLSVPPVAGFVPASGNALQNEIKGKVQGARGTFEHCALPDIFFSGAKSARITPGSEHRELFMRLEIRFGSDYRDLVGDLGGKLPLGIGAQYWKPGTYRDWCGNAGMSCASGDRGWSARGGYKVVADPANPAYPMVQGHQYIYHYQQAGFYGRHVPWGAAGLFELDRWYTVEMQVVVNDPGQPNGILRIWVDGRLSREITDQVFRGPVTMPEIVAKGGQQLIRSAWPTWFHGGKHPPSHTMHGFMDNLVVAKEYIGPRRASHVPGAVPVPGG